MIASAVVQGVAHAVPNRTIKNDDLKQWMETSDDWITERTGIKERRFIEEGTTTCDLAEKAARQVMSQCEVKPEEIDLVIASTLAPDFYFPGIGTMLQHRLGIKNSVGALDIRAQCSGFVYGMNTADAYIRSGFAKKILLVCSEVQSPALDLSTRGREMAVLFGDGAGALLIEAQQQSERPSAKNKLRGVIDSMLGSDGSGAEVLYLRTPGTATPGFVTHQDIENAKTHPFMDGRIVFKNAVTRMCQVTEAMCKKNEVTPDQIKLLFPHQANLRINEMVREKLGLPPERVFNNIQKYGNTTSATIPICLSEAVAQGKLERGDLIMSVAFGAGFTWGCNLIRW